MKKLLFSLLIVVMASPVVMSESILIVTDAPELEVAGGGQLGDYLRSLGYQVTADEGNPDQNPGGNSAYRDILSDEQIAHLESFDLVIVHRSTNSGDFDNFIEQWNELQVPLLLGSAYLGRNNPLRWNWVVGGQARETSQNLFIEDENHPIVRGMGIDVFTEPRDVDYLNTAGDVGNGHLIASTEVNFGTYIASWDDPGSFVPDGVETHTHRRVFFALLRYFEASDTDCIGCSFDNYTDNGKRLIANAVEYAIHGVVTGLPPTNVGNWDLY